MLPAGLVFGAVFVYRAMCNLFPQGRSAKMAHPSLGGALFFFFLFFFFKGNQANPHIERKIAPFGCCLVRSTGAFERHSVSAEGVDSGLCRSPGTPPSPRLFLWSSWVGMGGAGLQKAEAKDARRWAGPASKRPSPGRFLLGVQSPCLLFCPCQEEVPTCRRHPLLQHPSASSTRAPYEHFSRPSGK